MRTARQSTFRQPLDEILGTVSSVRTLRELVRHGEPLIPADIARRTEMTSASIGSALDRLDRLGIVEPVGSGARPSYRLRDGHFLAEPIRRLFRREAARREHLFDALADLAERTEPRPVAVCLYGSVARRSDRPGSDLDLVALVASDRDRPAVESSFSDALLDLEEEWNLPPTSLVVLTEDELAEGTEREKEYFLNLLEEAVPVFGRLRNAAGSG